MELIDVFDENENFLNYSVDRNEVHEKNLWHRHASAWIMNHDGLILLQQRAFDKKKNPGKWAKTGGHVDAGETCIDALKREVYEEIGIKINDEDIIPISVFKSDNPNEHFFSYGYIILTDLKENEFKLQKEEVNSVKYFSIEELENIKSEKNGNFTFNNWDDEDFFMQMNLLKEYRKSLKK